MEFLISIATISILYWLIHTWEKKAAKDKAKRTKPRGDYPSARIRTITSGRGDLDECEHKISD